MLMMMISLLKDKHLIKFRNFVEIGSLKDFIRDNFYFICKMKTALFQKFIDGLFKNNLYKNLF